VEPYWMTIARAELRRGVYEIPGPDSEARIELYQSTCRWKHSDDAIAWCSSFVNFCVEGGDEAYDLLVGGVVPFSVGTKSARARSWLQWGASISLQHAPIGALLIMKRGPEPQPGPEVVDAKGHTCFFDGWATPLHIRGVGGNQSNMVRSSIYPANKVIGVRWAA
jgi:uncharacterized protein (TIGR02594 family)